MKPLIYLIPAFIFLSACQKEEISEGINNDNQVHSYTGDLLLLVVSDTLEAAYTYSFSSAQLYTDSLPIFHTLSSVNPFDDKDFHLHFASATDTLYTRSHPGAMSYNGTPLPHQQLISSFNSMPFDLKNFTLEYLNHKNQIEKSWYKISNLSVVRSYRSFAQSKIYGQRIIEMVFDPELGFSAPKAKYLFIFSKW
ncbi:hypothetical protein SAMN05216474_2335 [Lishizhenia tianjinensis]|uniref:Lipoprotein n=1 Tax=Lishizhenia tianjinensis TaxID=477690 RepID=A0A1I7AVR7_9FLAO|nr:hypothetical protein [Lishizhenia tianjinensis]SFT79023.1 hypothetical protein SAMN05216474_2335 [Lishizhenia tianjinensis]